MDAVVSISIACATLAGEEALISAHINASIEIIGTIINANAAETGGYGKLRLGSMDVDRTLSTKSYISTNFSNADKYTYLFATPVIGRFWYFITLRFQPERILQSCEIFRSSTRGK